MEIKAMKGIGKRVTMIKLLTFLVLLGNASWSAAIELSSLPRSVKDLVEEGDYLRNTGSDGYLKISGLNVPRNQACYLVMDLELANKMFRPGLFELFWATRPDAFTEQQKTRFVLNHDDLASRRTVVLPLCKLYHFSGNLNEPLLQTNIVGMRLDYPMNREIAVQFHSMRLMDEQGFDELQSELADEARALLVVELYERVNAKSFISKDVFVPKLMFALEDGFKRLRGDFWFLIVWLGLIVGLLGLLARSFFRLKHAPD